MKRLLYLIPVLVFACLAWFLLDSLSGPAPGVLPSPLIGQEVPRTTLPALDSATEGFGPKDFTTGKVVLVNVFSSTCVPCRLEAPVLNRLAKMEGITLYGFVWKDSAANARAFLDQVGNPFRRIGIDTGGQLGIEWGIYGWPETYVVDGQGVIRFKYDAGPLTDEVVADQLLPAIARARGNS